MKYENKVQIEVLMILGLIVLCHVHGYPQKPEDKNAEKSDNNSTSPSPATTIATNVSALPTTVIAIQPTTIAASQQTTIAATSTASSLNTTIAIKPLEDVEPTNVERSKRQATIPAFPTNALPGNGTLPIGNFPPPSGSLPQPNIATAGTMNSGIPPSLPASPQTIASAAPKPASSLQPVKFPQAGK